MPASPAPTPISVRRVGEPEWERFRELRFRALREDPLAFGSTLEREEHFPEELWRERMAAPTSSYWIAADPDDRFVGMAVAARLEGEYHIFSMWVEPERRGAGLGGRLLDAALAWVEESTAGAPVRLDVNPRQVAAVRLYRSRGFRATGRSEPLGHSPNETVEAMVRPGARATHQA
jgi:ribosomal protein S18 acetylase RimI-like enzyme